MISTFKQLKMYKHEIPFKCYKSKIENVTFIDAFTVDLLAITIN